MESKRFVISLIVSDLFNIHGYGATGNYSMTLYVHPYYTEVDMSEFIVTAIKRNLNIIV